MSWIQAVKGYFPTAVSRQQLFDRANLALTKKGLTSNNTLFAECLCRDEINKSAIRQMGRRWGESFNLSGLAGFPISGVTGFSAYANHVPDNGYLFVLFGPHVGVDSEGKIGSIKREGMAGASSSCGSLLHYMSKVTQSSDYFPKFESYDAGQYLVESSLHGEQQKFLKANDPITAITELAFEKIEQNLLDVIARVSPANDIYLLGGILVNSPAEQEDHFVLKSALHKGKDSADYNRGWVEA